MTGKQSPWQNRPSLISTWEHTVSGFDITGDPVQDLSPLITQDNLLIWGGLPLCIPRACRMTKICGFFAYSIADQDYFTMDILGDPPCGYPSTVLDSFTVTGLSDTFLMNCICIDINAFFDRCDVWAPKFQVSDGDWYFPVFRFNFHFELR